MPSFVGVTDGFTDAVGKSKAVANAYPVLQSLAGRVRMLGELVMGASMVDGERALTARNPDGQLGVNFSGPPWGSAWRTPVFTFGGRRPITVGAGDWEGHRIVATAYASDGEVIIPIRYWCRGYAAQNAAPYSRVYPVIRAYQGVGGASFDVTVKCRTLLGASVDSRSEVFSLTSTTDATYVFSSALYWDVAPGRNLLEFVVSTAYASDSVRIASLTGNQIAKRSH